MKHYDIVHDYDDRKSALLELVPNVFKKDVYKTFLYIGADDTNFTFSKELKDTGGKITVVEIDNNACSRVGREFETINSDIVKYEPEKSFDIIIWWGGPEHIYEKDLQPTLNKLEKYCNHYIILMCPWGSSHANSTHYSHYDYEQFESLGYQVICLGVKNYETSPQASAIIAVKKIK